MNILLTNDDGIYAHGLWVLHQKLARTHTVTVIAPDRERSAVGHGITLHEPIRAHDVQINGNQNGFAVTGTPADCVKLGVTEILPQAPDIVISGINPGANVGADINYSGTVAAAKEAALNGLPAMAVSMRGPRVTHYDTAAQFAAELAADIQARGLPFGTCLNVNIPDQPMSAIAGVVISRQEFERLSESFERRTDPRNRTYYWQGRETPKDSGALDIDGTALARNYISVTPIKCDLTDYNMIETLKDWQLDKKVSAK
jgi:5'-nucleotidase